MKTDIERVKEFLTELGIGFKEDVSFFNKKAPTIICTVGDKKIVGYSGFFAEFNFNSDGSFQEMGIGE